VQASGLECRPEVRPVHFSRAPYQGTRSPHSQLAGLKEAAPRDTAESGEVPMSTTTQELAGPPSLPGDEGCNEEPKTGDPKRGRPERGQPTSTKPTRLWKRAASWLRCDSKSRTLLLRSTVAAWMNVLILAAAAATVVTAGFLAGKHWPAPQTWGAGALKLFALWCLAFLPGWLYVRFLGLRAKALWNEYVLNLHRLAWDMPWNLPEPPAASMFYERWAQRELHDRRPEDNIYRQKFEAYYGRQITDATEGSAAGRRGGRDPDEDYRVRSESLFPVFLTTVVLAVGWSAVLWDTRFITAPAGPWDVLKYGFIGAYAFVTSMLIRRFFQSDLRPSAYASAVFRIMLVLLIVAVLHQVMGGTTAVSDRAELAVAFVIGFFPLVGLQALQRATSRALGRVVPAVTSQYPLDQLDGFNLWYEARLTEEGVEDMQNLTTMNLVDVMLHTRVPPGRLVDWTDQAFLLIHLEPVDQKAESGTQARAKLRRAGIRTATDFLKAFSEPRPQPCDGLPGRAFAPPPIKDLPLPADQLRLLVAVLGAEPGLVPIWNWQQNGVPGCRHPDPAGQNGDPASLNGARACQQPDSPSRT